MAISSLSCTSESAIYELRKILTSEAENLSKRFRALFSLKHVTIKDSSLSALEAIAAAFSSPSALLKHEVAYCLGQTRNKAALPYLRAVLENINEDPMCRHEAAEAMGAIGDIQCLEILKHFKEAKDEPTVVRETCELAIDRIMWEHGETGEEGRNVREDSVEDLEKVLLNQEIPLFRRYRAMFGLRDLASPPDLPTAVPAILSLAKGLNDPSALFRHEIAFVFGQLSHPASIPALTTALSNLKEESMVRHEAAEALGSLGDQSGVNETLKRFLNDSEQVVRESVIVALDMADYELSGQAEYALVPEVSA